MVTPVSVLGSSVGVTPATTLAATMLGVYPTNQTDCESSVVPVLPAVGWAMSSAAPVPPGCMTPFSTLLTASATAGASTRLHSSLGSAIGLPVRSRIAVTGLAGQYIPRAANVA